jgi:hypothetical protein
MCGRYVIAYDPDTLVAGLQPGAHPAVPETLERRAEYRRAGGARDEARRARLRSDAGRSTSEGEALIAPLA